MSMNRKQRRLQEKKLKKQSGKSTSQMRLNKTLDKFKGGAEVTRLHDLGREYMNKGDLVRATEAFAKALHLQPDHILTIEQMILASQQLKRFDSAEVFLKGLLEIDPEYARAYGYIGKFYMQQQDQNKALQYLNKGYEQYPDDPEILNTLALIHHRSSNAEEAEKYYRLAYEQEPSVLNIISWISATHKIKDKDDFVYQELLKFEKKADTLARHYKPLLYSALGKAHDQLKDYDLAFPYYTKAARAIRKTLHFQIQPHVFMVTEIKKYFDQTFFEKEAPHMAGNPSEEPVFIIGMPRSGSTLVEQMLDSHPDICGIGESNFITSYIQERMQMPARSDDVQFPMKSKTPGHNPNGLKNLANEYLSYLKAFDQKVPRYVDKALSNYLWLGAIVLAFPNAKIIHTKRNALDSCISCYQQIFQNYGHEYSYDLTELGLNYKAYDDLMRHWHNVLPGKILDVHYEDVVEDTEGQLRRILDHVGVPFDARCLEYHKNQRFVFTASAGQINQPIYKTAMNKWKRYEKYLEPLVKALGPSAPQDSLYILEKYGEKSDMA